MASNDSILVDVELNTTRMFEELKKIQQTLENFAKSVEAQMRKQDSNVRKQTNILTALYNLQARGVQNVNDKLKSQDNWFREINRSALAFNATIASIVYGVGKLANAQFGDILSLRDLGYRSNVDPRDLQRMGLAFEQMGLTKEEGRSFMSQIGAERSKFLWSGQSALYGAMQGVGTRVNMSDLAGTMQNFAEQLRKMNKTQALAVVQQAGLERYANVLLDPSKDIRKAFGGASALFTQKDLDNAEKYRKLIPLFSHAVRIATHQSAVLGSFSQLISRFNSLFTIPTAG